jgi:hypothetical protein
MMINRATGVPLTPQQQGVLHAFERVFTPRSVWDLRVTDDTVAELVRGPLPLGEFPLKLKGIAVEPQLRSTPEYRKVMAELERYKVGEGKGVGDRRIVADVLFAQKTRGAPPAAFMTRDHKIINALRRIAGQDPNTLKRDLNQPFIVRIDAGSRAVEMRVIPLVSEHH